MTFNEVAEGFIELGGKEFPHPIHKNVRSFSFKGVEGPDCECNNRAPSLHVISWGDYLDYKGNVEFNITGEFGGQWLDAKIYSVHRHEAVAFLPRALKALTAVWIAYCNEMVDLKAPVE